MQTQGYDETEDQEADAILFEFYKNWCWWSIESKQIADWAFSKLQQECDGVIGYH